MGAIITMGKETEGANTVQFPPINNKAACRFQAPVSFTVSKYGGYWSAAAAGAKVKAIIYSDSSGSPDSLLGASDEKVGIAVGWNQFTFSTPVSLTGSSYYWIGVIADTMCTAHCVALTGGIKYNADTYSDGPAATFGAASTANYQYPAYVEGLDSQDRIGRAVVNEGSGTFGADSAFVEKFTLGGSDSASLSTIAVYVNTTSATVKAKFGVFADSSGLPGAKIGQSSEVTGTTAGTWLSTSISGTMTPGDYWLAVIFSEAISTTSIAHNGTLHSDYTDESEATAFPDPFPEPITDATPQGMDIYVTYSTITVIQLPTLQVAI